MGLANPRVFVPSHAQVETTAQRLCVCRNRKVLRQLSGHGFKLRIILKTGDVGNPSVFAIPRPVIPCALSRAMSSRCRSRVTGRPNLYSTRLRRRNTIVYAFTDDFALELGYRAENIQLKPCG